MMNLYFAYGSNHPEQMKKRIGRLPKFYPAYLENYQRKFRGYSHNWNGGVATVDYVKNKFVFGLAYEVTNDELDLLDQYEGSAYKRKNIKGHVIKDSDIEQNLIVYVRSDTGFTMPSKSYLEAVLKTINTSWSKDNGKKYKISDITIA